MSSKVKSKLNLSSLIDNPNELIKNSNENEEPDFDSSIIKTAASVVQTDPGDLLAFDPRPIDSIELKKNPDSYIKNICQISTQLLINQLFNLPVERVEDVIVAKLPTRTTVFPREKPLPKEKPLTKWEQYAKLKGIKNKKKSRMVFDETTKEWRPTWGYKKAKDKDDTNNWLIEIKKNEDPNQDFFSKRTEAKNERVAKNELQRLRNIARGTKKKVPGIGLTPLVTDDKIQDKFKLKKALQMAKTADASMSKFSQKLENEDKVTRGFAKKRKFESNYQSVQSEKEKQMKVFEKLTTNKDKSSKDKLNIDKATNKHIAAENNSNSKNKSPKNRRSSSGKHRRVSIKGKGRKGRK